MVKLGSRGKKVDFRSTVQKRETKGGEGRTGQLRSTDYIRAL